MLRRINFPGSMYTLVHFVMLASSQRDQKNAKMDLQLPLQKSLTLNLAPLLNAKLPHSRLLRQSRQCHNQSKSKVGVMAFFRNEKSGCGFENLTINPFVWHYPRCNVTLIHKHSRLLGDGVPVLNLERGSVSALLSPESDPFETVASKSDQIFHNAAVSAQ